MTGAPWGWRCFNLRSPMGMRRSMAWVATLAAASGLLWLGSGTMVRAAPTVCLDEAGWHVCYETTPTDGLRVSDVTYRGLAALTSGSLPQIDVDYSGFTLLDELGSQMIPAVGPVSVRRDADGLELAQTFQMSNWPQCSSYRYDMSWRFKADGLLEPTMTVFGPGMEGPHTYHIYWRLEVAPGPAGGDRFEYWDGDWRRPIQEGQFSTESPTSPDGDKWRVLDDDTGWALRPAGGLQGAAGWALRRVSGQGAIDLPAQRQVDFPGQWVNGEPIQDQSLVLWYRMSIHKPSNCNQAMRVTSGPVLVPVNLAAATPPPSTSVPRTSTIMAPTPTVALPTPEPTVPGAAMVRGRVYLQGRSNAAGVVIAVNGTPSAISGADGGFELAGVPPGRMALRADIAGYLCAGGDLDVVGGGSQDVRSASLRGGDVVRDDRVDLLDLVAVAAEYGNPAPGGSRADINLDGLVNLFDLVLVASNYRIVCPTDW